MMTPPSCSLSAVPENELVLVLSSGPRRGTPPRCLGRRRDEGPEEDPHPRARLFFFFPSSV